MGDAQQTPRPQGPGENRDRFYGVGEVGEAGVADHPIIAFLLVEGVEVLHPVREPVRLRHLRAGHRDHPLRVVYGSDVSSVHRVQVVRDHDTCSGPHVEDVASVRQAQQACYVTHPGGVVEHVRVPLVRPLVEELPLLGIPRPLTEIIIQRIHEITPWARRPDVRPPHPSPQPPRTPSPRSRG